MTITFALSHQIISRTDNMILASGSKNYVTAKFELLTEDWTAPITVIFNEYTVVLDEDNQCLVPWEVLAKPGKVAVSAFCGDLHTATSVLVPVHPGGYIEGRTPQPPTPSVYQELTELVKEAVETANDVQRRADAGEFDGKQGPMGPEGPKGQDGTVSFDELTEEQRESLIGPQGPVGPQGKQGEQGEQGPAGKDGNDGQDGAQGLEGPAGQDGKSAYAYAQDGGYTGTEEEFASKLAAEFLSVSDSAGFHNAVYRGKNLGSSVTPEQWAAIKAGTFKDLFIGDYWVINGVNWRIAAFDYYLNTGDKLCTSHHAVIVPDTVLYAATMNDTDTNEGAYAGSKMRTSGLNQAKSTINSAFGAEHILQHRLILANACTGSTPTGISIYDSTVELMSERQLFGAPFGKQIRKVLCTPMNILSFPCSL